MSQAETTPRSQDSNNRVERLIEWYRDEFMERLRDLATKYPSESRSFEIDFDQLQTFDEDIARDLLDQPDTILDDLEEALRTVEIPLDISLNRAHVRVGRLPELYTYFPGTFSPADEVNAYRTIKGEISKATDLEPELKQAAWECLKCGATTYNEGLREPYECSCERKGPFRIDEDDSEFVDRQKARIKTPPDVADGVGSHVDAVFRDDIAGEVSVGDRVKVSGVLRLRAKSDNDPTNFEQYLEALHVEFEDTHETELEIDKSDTHRIQEYIDNPDVDPIELAAQNLHQGIYGYETEKRALILAAVGGEEQLYDDGTRDRGDIHVLLIGDSSTGKSQLGEAIYNLAVRSVSAQAALATGVGLTASCVRSDDFGDGGWEIRAGAFVKANNGLLWIDELDDLAQSDRRNLNNPMEAQRIEVRKADIEAEFETKATVIAAANPDNTQFDPYQPIAPQFGFDPSILSRFDLIFTFQDKPEESKDRNIAMTELGRNFAKTKENRGESVPEQLERFTQHTLDRELLQKWIHLARQQPKPEWESIETMETVAEAYTEMRGIYNYEEDQPRAITARKLGAMRRLCEAVAKFHLSDEITLEHAESALEIIRASMDAVADEEGNYDADVVESGRSKTQQARIDAIEQAFTELQEEYGGAAVPADDVVERLDEFSPKTVRDTIKQLYDRGELTSPGQDDSYRYVGRY